MTHDYYLLSVTSLGNDVMHTDQERQEAFPAVGLKLEESVERKGKFDKKMRKNMHIEVRTQKL